MPQPELKIKPNTTMVSNLFLDNMDLYSGNAVKIFIFISRKTSGWHKETQWCSISYIMKGTGIGNKNSVIKEVNILLKDGWLKRSPIAVRGGTSFEYLLSETIDMEAVSKTYRYESDTGIKNVPLGGTKVIPLSKESGTKLIHNKRNNNILNKQSNKETIYTQEAREVLEVWNEVKKTRFRILESFIDNFTSWREFYQLPEIIQAIRNSALDKEFLANVTDIATFFRKKNRQGEKVDYIGRCLQIDADEAESFDEGYGAFLARVNTLASPKSFLPTDKSRQQWEKAIQAGITAPQLGFVLSVASKDAVFRGKNQKGIDYFRPDTLTRMDVIQDFLNRKKGGGST